MLGGGGGGKKNRQKERRLMKGFNIAPPGSTGSLAPVAEFSTSFDNFDQQHEILTSTLSTLFTPTFMHKKPPYGSERSASGNGGGGDSCNSMDSPPSSLSMLPTAAAAPTVAAPAPSKYNKSTLKLYNKRIVGHKKKWGTLIEAAKVGNVSKMLGRSKSEDSVCNSSTNSLPIHGQVHVSYAQNCGQHFYSGVTGEEATANVPGNNNIVGAGSSALAAMAASGNHGTKATNGVGTHIFHTTSGKLYLESNKKM